jgi:hypothetical protein
MVVHLTYPDLAARLELITRRLGRLARCEPPRQLFFADVPVAGAAGLEIVQLHQRQDSSVWTDLAAWLASCHADGLIRTATQAEASLVLDPRLFLDGQVPTSHLVEMVGLSARAAEVLRRLQRPASEAEVRDELAALYTRLLPDERDRQHALELHARWLERAASGANQPRPPQAAPDPRTIVASRIARLAHTHAVRLRGPGYDDWLTLEARLVRQLVRSQPESRCSAARGELTA